VAICEPDRLAGQAGGKETVRPSSYLNTIEIGDGSSLLYNGLSMCIDVVPSQIARRLVSSQEGDDFSFLMPPEKEHLEKRGHLTRSTAAGEQEAMRRLTSAIAERDAGLNRLPFRQKMVTFILTYQCNLSCAYCYQSEIRRTSSPSSMTEAFVDDFFSNYLHKLLHCEPDSNLSFLLYGGEPLLPGNRGAIERILRYAKKHGIAVSTVTNAVTLPKMLDLIGPEMGKINNVQVTLDGGQMSHDQKRVSKSGGPTFQQTITAIGELTKAGANASIRIHLHPGDLETARVLVEYLEQENILGHDRVKVYFWSTEDLHREALSTEEYEIFSRLFQDVALRQHRVPTAHLSFLGQIAGMKTARVHLVPVQCDICVASLHCVVDPLGHVYQCIDDAGHKDRRIGSLAGGEVEYFGLSEDHKKLHIRDKPECLRCSIALYCGGGCVNRLKTHQDDSPVAPFCLQIKEFVGQTLKAHLLLSRTDNTGDQAMPMCYCTTSALSTGPA
jgi:uncharacterized protein